jgi:hypothetical protein
LKPIRQQRDHDALEFRFLGISGTSVASLDPGKSFTQQSDLIAQTPKIRRPGGRLKKIGYTRTIAPIDIWWRPYRLQSPAKSFRLFQGFLRDGTFPAELLPGMDNAAANRDFVAQIDRYSRCPMQVVDRRLKFLSERCFYDDCFVVLPSFCGIMFG